MLSLCWATKRLNGTHETEESRSTCFQTVINTGVERKNCNVEIESVFLVSNLIAVTVACGEEELCNVTIESVFLVSEQCDQTCPLLTLLAALLDPFSGRSSCGGIPAPLVLHLATSGITVRTTMPLTTSNPAVR